MGREIMFVDRIIKYPKDINPSQLDIKIYGILIKILTFHETWQVDPKIWKRVKRK